LGEGEKEETKRKREEGAREKGRSEPQRALNGYQCTVVSIRVVPISSKEVCSASDIFF
jgi:hypothetical protein